VTETASDALGRGFMFATGVECSYPTVTGRNGAAARVDQLELTFHYRHYKEDLELVRALGLRYLRYGPPYYRVQLGPERYDWEFTDAAFGEMRALGIVPIADLCHFGVPDWIGDFQNPEFPAHFAAYARAFAERFPWVRLYTPINEIYVCAKLSTLAGFWNERRKNDERAFVTALKHLCKANLLAIAQILEVRPDAVFVQSESAEYFHAGAADASTLGRSRFENERRFLSFDLLYSTPPSAEIGRYLFDHGMSREEYDWFMHHGLDGRIVMGNDFYEQNEQVVGARGELKPAGEVFGWQTITLDYYRRYGRPVMHTETNTRNADEAPRWLWKEFFNVRNLRQRGVPVLGFTWYSLLDQVDWNAALERDFGVVSAVGLFDLNRKPRPVAAAYSELLRSFADEPLFPKSSALTLIDGARMKPVESRPPPQSRRRPPPPPAQLRRARVAIARSEKRRVDAEDVELLVRQVLAELGGMERFVGPGQTVLIKPNQTLWRTAKDGTTTDPRVVAALARIAREAGAARVFVGECSSCGQVTREIFAITGMAEAAARAGAELVCFDEVPDVELDVPQGKLIRRIAVPLPLLEADVVIACPKLKTHFLDPISGALKLWVGAARQDTMHRLHRDRVEEAVADLLTVTRPDLAIMDAIIAGEGDGPIATRGRFVGAVLGSEDPVALDVVAADLAGFDAWSLGFARAAAQRGIGVLARSQIEVVGVPLERARVPLAAARKQDFQGYAARVIVGEGVTLAGTLGHFKGFADYWHKDRIWRAVAALRGRPTFMIGRVEDPDFERNLAGGPYFVLDDAALPKYKHDPRVTFIPGSPIGNEMMPIIMQALGVDRAGRLTERLLKVWNRFRSSSLAR
jgi:uncharacterized protein (DUF362 family)